MSNNKIIKSSLARRNLQKFLSNKLAIVGFVMVFVLILSAAFAPLLTKYDPGFINVAERLQKPSMQHLLGTDNVGRDLFTRLLYGGRVSLFIGIVSAVTSALIGVSLGAVSGYYGGKVDSIILYTSEIFMSFPSMILILILIGFTGRGLFNIIFIFSIIGWTSSLRIVRSRIFSLREESFVESLKASGIGGFSIMFKHLLPNTLGPIIVGITLSTGGYVLAEAGLSFIGMGVDPTTPTWGNIMMAAKSLRIMQNYPALWIAPGVSISLFLLGINFFGDGLRDVFDPKN